MVSFEHITFFEYVYEVTHKSIIMKTHFNFVILEDSSIHPVYKMACKF